LKIGQNLTKLQARHSGRLSIITV